MTFLLVKQLRGNTFEAEVSKLVMRLVRHHDQHEGETDGAGSKNFEKCSRGLEGKHSRTVIGFLYLRRKQQN